MENQPDHKSISKGNCVFCETEIAKNRMTQHLKFCKQRFATIAKQEEKAQKKTHLFHILAEGQYSPQYWLHFEVPATESLRTLDSFLKDMWIDDLDHLSGFTINGTNYNDDDPDDFYNFSKSKEAEQKIAEGGEPEEEQKMSALIDQAVATFATMPTLYLDIPSEAEPDLSLTEWIANVKKPRSVEELVDFLKVELARIMKEDKLSWKNDQGVSLEEKRKRYYFWRCQKLTVEELLDIFEDRSMDVSLERVLKVGQKFSYVYDYGSSTYINLRVMGEREGIVQEKKKPVQLLARNTAQTFPCIVCGEPATIVAMGYFTSSIEKSVFCTKCANEQVDEGMALPIINSPRAGVL